MAIGGMRSQAVEISELLDFFQRLCRERRLAFKGVEHNPLEQIAQRHVLQFRDRLQHLEQSLFDSDASLDSFYLYGSLGLRHMYQCTTVGAALWAAGKVRTGQESSTRA